MSIFGKEYSLETPLSEQDARGLSAGDIVHISGAIWGGRLAVMKRFVEAHEPLPVDTRKLNVFFTGGEGVVPVPGRPGYWQPLSIGTLLGLRFERWYPGMIRGAGLRAIIAKGTTGADTRQACMECGCVQLTSLGWTVTPRFGDALVDGIKDEDIHWREAGLIESLVVYRLKDSGPWVVNVDTTGNVLFDGLNQKVDNRLEEIYRGWGISRDFKPDTWLD
ncbi:MAG: fumarate hydratase C-terminal domain-containing protein [Chloroflexi bacterium]|nr:fumarate hydratase C-terminal domain-containing protein [Chloroflexota bacterium]